MPLSPVLTTYIPLSQLTLSQPTVISRLHLLYNRPLYNMSSLAAVYLLLLCLYSNLHACTCNRPLPLSQIQLLSPKGVKTPAGSFAGSKLRATYSRKIFEDTAEQKERKREEHMTPEKKEAIVKGSDPMEGIVVMDYAQPHRKPPVHNK